jgi:hypothetical protein
VRKKFDFKLKKHSLIFVATTVLIGAAGIYSVLALSPQAPKAYTDSPKKVAVSNQESTQTKAAKVDKEESLTVVPQNNQTEPAAQAGPAQTQPQEQTPTQSIYEKYGINPSIAQQFESYYPTYAAYNKELFISNVATIVNALGVDNAERFLVKHVHDTGLIAGNKQTEKNSFMQLLLGGGGRYSSSLVSLQPWASVI